MEIEEKIQKWSNQTYSEKGNRSVMQKKDEKSREENVKKDVVEEKPKVEPKKEEDKKKYTVKL